MSPFKHRLNGNNDVYHDPQLTSSRQDTALDFENAIPLVSPTKGKPPVAGNDYQDATRPHQPRNRPSLQGLQHGHPQAPGLLRKWRVEFFCCVLVVAAFMAIVATLQPFSGKPLPQWPYGLSVNTLISIYTTTLKTAMLYVVAQGLSQLKWDWFKHTRPLSDLARYDNASRGSWGAISLVWELGRRNTFVPFVGAAVTILAVLVDPFAQQIVRYYTCMQPAPGTTASIPRANVYQDRDWSAIHSGANLIELGVGTQAAISAGTFSASAFSLAARCPTGNCTFPHPYWSVGFCGSCSDVSSELKKSNYTYLANVTSTASGGLQPPLVLSNTTAGHNVEQWTLNYTLPSGLFINPDNAVSVYAMGGYYAENSGYTITPTTTIEAIYIPPSEMRSCASGSDPWACKGHGAARCELMPCVKEYSATLEGGSLHETLQQSVSAWAAVSNSWLSSVDLRCVTESQKSLLRRAGYQFETDTRWLAYNVSVVDITTTGDGNYWGGPSAGPDLAYYADSSFDYSNATQSIVPTECIYSYDIPSANALTAWLANYFNGTLHFAPEALFVTQNGDNTPGGATPVTASPSALLIDLFGSNGVTLNKINATMARITESVTTYIRQNGIARLSSPAVGLATHNETCVRVRWAWVAFPAALVLMMFVFFGAMLGGIERRGHHVHNHDFKSNVLPLMFHGLYDDGHDASGRGIGTVDQMNRDARNMMVALNPTERGWRFVEVGQDKDSL